MSFRLFVIAGALSALSLDAQTKTQNAEVKWGRELNDKEDGNFQTIMGTTDEAIYMLMNRRKELMVQRTDLDLKVAYQKPLEKQLTEDDRSLEKILVTDQRITVFSSKYDRKLDRNTLFARAYSAADYSPVDKEKVIATIPSEHKGNAGEFGVGFTNDDKYIRVKVFEPREKKEMTPKYRTIFMDMDLNEVSGGDVPEEVRIEFPEDFSVDDGITTADGTRMYVGRKYPEKRERKELRRQNKPDHSYWLLVYAPGATEAQEYPIAVNDKFLQDLTFREDVKGNIVCSGFYGNKGSWSIRGVFFVRLDKATKHIVHESYKEFSDDFITEGMSEKEERKAKKKADRKDEDLELPNYKLDEMIQTADGGMVLVAEEYRSYTVCTTTRYGTTCNTHYIYNDIIAVNISPEGNIEWAVKVPKRQHTVNDDRYSSYVSHVKGDKLYLIFNDSGENLFLPKGEKYHQFELKGDDALVTICTIDGDGTLHREALFTQEKRGAIFKPNECVSLPDDRLFIYAERKSDYRFGMIQFK